MVFVSGELMWFARAGVCYRLPVIIAGNLLLKQRGEIVPVNRFEQRAGDVDVF